MWGAWWMLLEHRQPSKIKFAFPAFPVRHARSAIFPPHAANDQFDKLCGKSGLLFREYSRRRVPGQPCLIQETGTAFLFHPRETG